ncbi:hypothetical protein RB597_006427 [Gaeumannomyces tritici]
MAAAFSEPDDPYAADGEGTNPQHRRPPRTSSRARDSASLPANRLRQRPTTKHAAASDVPGQPHSPGGGRHNPYHRTRDDDDKHALAKPPDFPPQLPPLPLTPSSPRWDSLTGRINKTTSHAQPPSQFMHTSRHQTFHQLPSPVKTNSNPSSPAASTTQALAQVLSAALPISPISPASSSRSYTPSHGRRSSLLDEEQDRIVSLVPPPNKFHATSLAGNHPPARTSSKGALARSSSRRTGDDQAPVMVENFSRPRKPSIARPNVGPPVPPTAARPAQYGNDSPILNRQLSNWPRTRGPSVSSNKSNGTISSLPTRPSIDTLSNPSRTVPRTIATNAAAPSAGGGMISPGLPKPQLAHTRLDGHGPDIPANPRDAAPWVAEHEPRSSYRSQLTSSTAPGTVFSGPNTQRSSLATKTSSRTSSSVYNFMAGHSADEGGMSVEDVMGLYEKGFADSTGAEDNDLEATPATRGHTRKVSSSKFSTRSRSSSRANLDRSQSHVGHRIREAMSDSLPMPTKPRGASDPPPSITVRDSMSFFSGSALPSSLPEDGRPEHKPRPSIASRGRSSHEEVDDSVRSKHDSAKLLESDDTVRPRMGHSRQASAASSARSASLAPRLAMSSPDLTQTTFDTQPAPPVPTQSQAQQLYSAPTEDEPDSRDRYGFRKSNQYVSREQYDAWDSTHTEYLARRKKKWVAYLRDSGLMTEEPDRFPAPSAKTKRFIRKGIPPEWRGAAWFYYARGPSILAKHPGVYDELIARSKRPGEAKEVDVEAIERDLHRTFPDNAKFRFSSSEPEGSGNNNIAKDGAEEPRIISRLRRVLNAFAIYNPQIGYCQSLNFLAGLLLLFVETEEQAFWLLNVITRVHLPGTHELSLEGSKVDLGVLMGAVKDSMPNVWNKVGSELDTVEARPATQGAGGKPKRSRRARAAARAAQGAERLPPITMCMTAWFMSCFIGTLPIETTLRVWDVFFYEGSRTLFRVALAIFKMGEAEIRAVQDPMEMFGVVQALPRRLVDCNSVMEATFKRRNGFGHLSQEAIEERRSERREAIKGAELAAANAGHATDAEGPAEVRRKGTLFGRRNRDRD